MIRYIVTFTGQVQGVGFRYTTQRVAERFPVTGWVRNEPDGSVRCVAEGQPSELERFIKAVQDAMHGYISDMRIETAPATGEFSSFTVAR